MLNDVLYYIGVVVVAAAYIEFVLVPVVRRVISLVRYRGFDDEQ